MRLKKCFALLLVVVLVLGLTGCRVRPSDEFGPTARLDAEEQLNNVKEAFNGNISSDVRTADSDVQELDQEQEEQDEPEPRQITSPQNPQASTSRNTTSKASSGKSPKKSPGKKGGSGNGDDKGDGNGDGDGNGNQDPDQSQEDTAYDSHNTGLTRNLGKVQPCQRFYVYVEDEGGNVAVNTTECNICIGAGCNNAKSVAADPVMIIKFVDSSVLGKGITNVSAAAQIAAETCDKYEEFEIEEVVIVSSQLLGTKNGRLVTKYYLAEALYPELMSELNPDAVRDELLGSDYEGIYVYRW